jgi:hypothetical protein
VIDVRDDAEIARMLDTHEARQLCGCRESSTSVGSSFGCPRNSGSGERRLPACKSRQLTETQCPEFITVRTPNVAGKLPATAGWQPALPRLLQVGNCRSCSYNRVKCQS